MRVRGVLKGEGASETTAPKCTKDAVVACPRPGEGFLIVRVVGELPAKSTLGCAFSFFKKE